MAAEDKGDQVEDAEVKTVTTAVARVEEKPPKELARPDDFRKLSDKDLTELIVKTGVYKDAKDYATTAMKVRLGYEMGLDPVTAQSAILIVNGKPAFSAGFIAARVKQSKKYNFRVLTKNAEVCRIQFLERTEKYTPEGKQYWEWEPSGPPEEFTMKMAERAGLTRNPTWKSYPEAMLFSRALTSGARSYAPDAIQAGVGIYTADELAPDAKIKVDANGEVTVDLEDSPPPKPAAAKPKPPPPPQTDRADTIREIKETASKIGLDLKPFGQQLYQKDDMNKLTPDELSDLLRKVQQRAKATPLAA